MAMLATAELAQSVERTTLNRVVVGSIPTFGENFWIYNKNHCIDVYFIKDDSTRRIYFSLTMGTHVISQ